MDSTAHIDQDQEPQVQRIRQALGAIAAREPAVFWIYEDRSGTWCVRREGALEEHQFGTRDAALAFVEIEAARCSSYRLFVAGEDGRFKVASPNWLSAR